MILRAALANWDGRTAQDIRAIHEDHHSASGYLADILALASDPALEVGATWLLKQGLERGAFTLTKEEAATLLKAARAFEAPDATLHILQIVPQMDIPEEAIPDLLGILHLAEASPRTFLRAWAYTGWHTLAVQHPAFREEVASRLRTGAQTETAASARVRIRKAIEAGLP
ncbi:MAG: hypothetical protein AAFY59_02775 [Pseudomonadota bacterium]